MTLTWSKNRKKDFRSPSEMDYHPSHLTAVERKSPKQRRILSWWSPRQSPVHGAFTWKQCRKLFWFIYRKRLFFPVTIRIELTSQPHPTCVSRDGSAYRGLPASTRRRKLQVCLLVGWLFNVPARCDLYLRDGSLTEVCLRPREDRNCSLFVGCLTSQQHASVSQGWICSDNFTGCHTEIEVADQTFHLILSQYTDTGPTSPSADPITPGAWQGSHWSANI